MVDLLILSTVILLILDCLLITTLRKLIYSFLLSKRNLKSAKKIHQQQSKTNRITLSYIKCHT